MENNRKILIRKNIFLIIVIITIFVILGLGTYALVEWTNSPEDATEITLRIGETTALVCATGEDLTISNLGPVFDYESENVEGNIVEASVMNYLGTEANISASLTINSITDNLIEESFKYVVLYSQDEVNYTKLTEGDFSKASNNSTIYFFTDHTIDVNTYYKVIFYIDANMQNPIDMQSGVLNATFSICVEGSPTASDKILSLATTEACAAGGSGVCATNSYTDTDGTTKYHDYRYRGADVNNFVSFNNDLYRIIGVFDDNSHGVEGEYLVKLIMADSLNSVSWGVYNSSATSGTYSSYKNDWTGNTTGVKANLNVLLNEYFYNKTNTSSTYGTCSTWTYPYSNTNYRTNDCTKIVGYGIDSTYQNYIEDVTWYLYGYSGNGLSKQNFYLCERGSYDGCTSANSGAYDTSTTAKIGLMYVSDYMYASSYYSSSDTTIGTSYYYGNKNWLYDGGEWMITPYSTNATYSFYVNLGYVTSNNTNNGKYVRPTFYLKSSVQISGGSGTIDNPYTLSM